MKPRSFLLSAWVALVYALHQDVWNWERSEPRLFGLFPPGLWYHLGYSILAAVTMALLVKYAWPPGLDDGGDKS